MKLKHTTRIILISFCISFVCSGCLYIFHKTQVTTHVTDEQVIKTPVKAHLHDGSTVLFSNGVVFSKNKFIGYGSVYTIDLQHSGSVSELNLADIAAFEIFSKEVDPVPTFFVSVAATPFGIVGGIVIFKTMFGSCPTVYSEVENASILEAELFSNSIAPMLESRDLTRLNARADMEGNVRLEIRNEALETHYINHLELIGFIHKEDRFPVADIMGRPLSLDKFLEPRVATNAAGTDLRETLGKPDNNFYSGGMNFNPDMVSWDSIELVFEPPHSNNSALHIRGRNTLFSTVYLYDFILGGRGILALDWLGTEMKTVSEAVALGDFYQRFMGIRVDLEINGEYSQIANIPNAGPIAWKDHAVLMTDIQSEDSVRIRLRFLSDSWQLDQVRLAVDVDEPDYKTIPVSRIWNHEGELAIEQLPRINASNGEYLLTYPGDKFTVEFDVESAPEEFVTGLFLAAQGYYIEWIRADWIMDPDPFFEPDYTDEMMARVQQRWFQVKHDFEKQFFDSKITVP